MLLEPKIQYVILGYRPTSIMDYSGDSLDILLYSPNNEDIIFYEFYYNKCYQKALNDGIFTEKEVIKNAVESQILSKDHDQEVTTLQGGISNLKESIDPEEGIFAGKKHKINQVNKKIKELSQRLSYLQNLKSSIVADSAEVLSNTCAHLYLIQRVARKLDKKLMWDMSQFENSCDLTLINNILLEYFKNSLSLSQIREIARSPDWRFKWAGAQKSGDGLFGVPAVEYTQEQSMIVMWSQIYDNAYESQDRPTQHIIDNDDLFDRWLSRRSTSTNTPHKNKPLKAGGMRETFMMAGDETDAEIIYEKNSTATRKSLERENKKIEEVGQISEYDLRKGLYQNNLEKGKVHGKTSRYL